MISQFRLIKYLAGVFIAVLPVGLGICSLSVIFELSIQAEDSYKDWSQTKTVIGGKIRGL